ncbi:exonuclease domain-containing protein [Streptomyces parvulus]|uniref:exonuclease domain-containing protein n=1 Tax=Streptomyces parvulus TaxID=146923 RepID=UPI00381ED412
MNALGWTRRPLVGLDFETTGTDVETARIVTASVVRWGGGLPTVVGNWTSDLGGAEIPAAATAIHGITTEAARDAGRPAPAVVQEITGALVELTRAGWPVVAMCAQFDLTILDRECARYGVRSLWDQSAPLVLDPRVLDKEVDRYRKGSRRLVDLCRHYVVQMDGSAHNSEVDARAACGVVSAIGRRYPRIGKADIGELHERQVRWARAQDADYRAYVEASGGEVSDAPFDWPLIPAPAAVEPGNTAVPAPFKPGGYLSGWARGGEE